MKSKKVLLWLMFILGVAAGYLIGKALKGRTAKAFPTETSILEYSSGPSATASKWQLNRFRKVPYK